MDASNQQAFDLGWDYASFGIAVPEDANKLFCDGYRAFGSGGTRASREPDRFVRKWLQIRFGAFQRGKVFSPEVTPIYLEKITPASGRCPVTGELFTIAKSVATDWSVDRANNDRGYVCGNIIIISRHVNTAKSDKSLEQIRLLALETCETEGLTPDQWRKLSQLIEPAFGVYDDSECPVPTLFGQPVALGMPLSPLAAFQVALSRAVIEGWDLEKRNYMVTYLQGIHHLVCRTRFQKKAFDRLFKDIVRRSRVTQSYSDVWATSRVQKRLWSFVETLDGPGLLRLVKLQEKIMGNQNTKIL